MTTIDRGLERVLNNLEQGIADVRKDIHALEAKVDVLADTKVSKTEFDAYRELRRTTVRWAVGTIISMGLFMLTAVSVLIMTGTGG